MGAIRQRKMTQMKEQIKTKRKKELSDEEIANLSDEQFKTLVIRMLTEMIKNRHKINEEVKVMYGEIKQNIQGTNSEGKETRTQIKDLEQKEEMKAKQSEIKENILGANREGKGTGTQISDLEQKEENKHPRTKRRNKNSKKKLEQA